MLQHFFRPLCWVVFVFTFNSVATAQDWQQLYDEAISSYDQGDYIATISKGKQALESAESDITKLYTLKLLSTASSESGMHEEGIAFGLDEVSLCQSLGSPDSVTYNSLHTLGVNFLAIEDYNNARIYLKRSSLAAFNHYGENSIEYNLPLSELGYSYYMLENIDSAILCLKTANTRLIEIPEGGIDFLNNAYLIGLIYSEKGDFLKAQKSYLELKELLELNDLQNDQIYAETCENLGTIQYNLEQFEEAELTLLASLDSYLRQGYEHSDITELINTLALVYIKLDDTEKSDSLLSLIGTDDMDRNVTINQINLANNHFKNEDYESAKKIVGNLEGTLNPESDKSLIAEVYLLQVKLDLAEGNMAEIEKIEYCLETFFSEENFERLLESYLFKTRIHISQLDFSNAETTIEGAFAYLNPDKVSQNMIYLIVRESISLFLRQGKPLEATTTFQKIEAEGILNESHREKLINDYAVLLQINGYAFESSLMFDLLVESSEYPNQAEYHINLIKSLINQSIYGQATYEIERLIESASENGIEENSKLFAEIYLQRAKVYLNEGNFSKAETDFRNSIEILNNGSIQDNMAKAEIFNSTAIFYQTIGNYEEALKFYAQAEEFTDDGSSLSIDILQNIATLKQIIGDYLESIVLLESALEGYANIYGKEHPAYSTSLQNLATAYQKSGDPEKALPYLEEAIRIDEANNLTGTVSHTTKHHNLAVLYQELDMLEESESNFREVVKMRKDILGEDHPDYAFSLYNLAVVLQRMNNTEEALVVFNEAIGKYKTLVREFFPYLSEKEKSAFYGKIKEAFTAWLDFTVEYAMGHPATAGDIYDFQLENKAVLLNASVDLRAKVASTGDESTMELFEEWLTLKEETVKLLSLSEVELQASGKNIADLQTRANDLEKDLSLKSNKFGENRSVVDMSWENVRRNLKEGEAAVEIFRIRKNIKNDSVWYVALIVTPDNEDNPEMEVFENGLELENKWFKFYRNSIRFKVADTLSFSKFWEPIKKHLAGTKTIYVAPDGIYNKISLNTLYDSEKDIYIVDEYNVHYLSNIKEILAVNENGFELKKEVHLYGNPIFEMEGDGSGIKGNKIALLPGTEEEIKSIEDLLLENGWTVDANMEVLASEKNIKQKEQAGVLHIATHGIFLEDSNPENDFYSLENNPLMRSGLLLSGAENTYTGDKIVVNTSVEGEDGVLTAYEIMNMDLSNTDLVVLSACETGLGEVKNGEGVYGLQRAFAIAGVKTIVISLWKVNDEATKDLMISFYQYYIGGKNKFEALAAAQRDMIAKYNDPYFWGAFVMSGI